MPDDSCARVRRRPWVAVSRLTVGEPVGWSTRWMCFQHHHTGEDEAIWPLLLTNTADDADRTATPHAKEAQHAEVDAA